MTSPTDTKWPGPITVTGTFSRPDEERVTSEHALLNIMWEKPDHAALVAMIGEVSVEFQLSRKAADALAQGLLGVARLIEYREV